MVYYTREEIESKIKELEKKGINSLGDALKLSFWKDQLLKKCK